MTAAGVTLERLPHVEGLTAFWERATLRAAPGPLTMAQRVMLDALGLGLEQSLGYLSRERPDRAAFERWVLDTAGPPDPLAIARYHAWLAGDPPPEPMRRRLREIEQAPDTLDATDLAHWESRGYVVLRSALSAEEVAAAGALLWRVAGAVPDDPASWYGERTNGIMVQHFQHPALEAARRSPRIHKAFAQLWGTADLWTIVDRLSFNPPLRARETFRPPRLHWDVSLATPIPFATQGILYLADTTADQGALELVPGFHRRIEAWLESLGDQDPRQVDLSAEAITVPGGAGDLVIWRQDLPHGASPNRAACPRLAQYLNMYSPELTVHPDWR